MPLGTSASNGPLLHPSDDRWRNREQRWNDTGGKINIIGEIPALIPICPPRKPHGMPRAGFQVSAVRWRQQTAWAMACRTYSCLRPSCNQRWLGRIQNQRIKIWTGENLPVGKVHRYRSVNNKTFSKLGTQVETREKPGWLTRYCFWLVFGRCRVRISVVT
jgi:hypothetical protein